MTGATIRRTLSICAMAIGLAIVAAPASAQTGQIKGKVVDQQGNPVDGVKITMYNQNTNRSLETKTNKKGEYIQVGLTPAKYKVTASKGELSDVKEVDIHLDMGALPDLVEQPLPSRLGEEMRDHGGHPLHRGAEPLVQVVFAP